MPCLSHGISPEPVGGFEWEALPRQTHTSQLKRLGAQGHRGGDAIAQRKLISVCPPPGRRASAAYLARCEMRSWTPLDTYTVETG